MNDVAEAAIPDGFVDPEIGGFVGNLGPILRCERDGEVVSGFIVEERHCNPFGTCHGGWLSTFVDVSTVRMAAIGGGRWVTSGLSVDFLQPVPIGSWVQSQLVRLPQGARGCAVQGLALVDGAAVLRMNAAFRRID